MIEWAIDVDGPLSMFCIAVINDVLLPVEALSSTSWSVESEDGDSGDCNCAGCDGTI